MADSRYTSGGTADISSFSFAPVARSSDELSVASWGGPSSYEPVLASRSLSSGLIPSHKSASQRTPSHHTPFNYPPLRSCSDSGVLQPNNSELFSASARDPSGCSLGANLSANNPIVRFYLDAEQPWAPPGLADPVPNAPLRRNPPCHSSSSNFDLRSGPHSDLSSAASGICRSDSGYGSQTVGSGSDKVVTEPSDSAVRRYPEVLLPLDPFPQFHTMTGLPPTPHSDGADSHLASTPRINSNLEPCRICGFKSKCPSDHKKHMLKHEKPFRCTQQGCSRTQGFITVNDLNRHLKSVHKVKVNCRTRSFKCASTKCRNPDKEWPRLDNFKQHIIRMHPDEDLQDLIERSELKDDFSTGLVLENTLAGMDASKYQSEAPSTSPANLMLTSSVQPFSSSWNSIQPSINFTENETRLPPISSTTSGFFQSDRPKVKSPRLSQSQSVHSLKRLPSVSFPSVPLPSASAGLSTLADAAAVADASVRQPTVNPLANMLGLGSSVQAVLNPETTCDTVKQDPLQSLSTLIANSIKNSNGSPLEDSIYRAIAQAVTQIPGTQSQTGSPELKQCHGPGPGHGDCGAGVGDNQTDSREDIMSVEEVNKQFEYLATKMRKQKSKDRKRSSGRVCIHCNKILPRACDMNKHIKRHTRPFGCTFHKCYKVFGSKNDWKRHENSQHFQIEMFRCQINDLSKRHGVCAKIFYARSAFEEHLKDGHKISDDRLVTDHIQEGRIGRGNQGRFWCGFCKKILALREQGVPGWDERFNHIDNHFKQGNSVESWVVAETNQTKEEMMAESRRRRKDQHSDEEEDNLSTSSSSSGDIPGITITAPAENPLKRKAPDDEGTGISPEWVYFCCQCGVGPFSEKLYKSCGFLSSECDHQWCSNCSRKRILGGIDLDLARLL